MTSSHPADLATVGLVDVTTLTCACGSTHTTPSRRVASTANRALATNVVNLDDFRAQRRWCTQHRTHGQIDQAA